uniref:ARAD1D46882p n=1 Tax=Blastobotrys adeninivorans TaxID=409370 RepID=A0A060TIJ0_BLAAD
MGFEYLRSPKFVKLAVVSAIVTMGLVSLLLYPDLLSQGPGFEPERHHGYHRPNHHPANPPPSPPGGHPDWKEEETVKGLADSDFERFDSGYFHHDKSDYGRYESVDAWRPHEVYDPSSEFRLPIPPLHEYRSKGEYLKQPLVADYAKNSDKMFFMIKTGASVLWDRLPIHLLTTLTRVPKFAIYSDAPASVAGHEVIDIFTNITEETRNHEKFTMYRAQKKIHDDQGVFDPGTTVHNGGWELDKFKNIPMLAHAYSVSPESDWFVFMDADSYIMLDALGSWLGTLDPDLALYLGSMAFLGDLPFAHGGSGVVLSRKAVEETIGKHPEYLAEYEREAFGVCCGDALVAKMLRDKMGLEISRGTQEYPHIGWRFQGNSFYDVMVTEEKWCQNILTFHHLTPHDVEVLWEYERLKGPYRSDITYGDIYRDFYLPFIDKRKENWDNLASQKAFKRAGDGVDPENHYPFDSFEACEQACKDWDKCMNFRYLPHAGYCGLSAEIKLGFPVSDDNKHGHTEDPDNKEAISGWNIERIQQVRRNLDCDPLGDREEHNDDPRYDRSEGWYLRRMASSN